MSETKDVEAKRFDIVWRGDDASIDYHFCRSWDGDRGCYGTNPDHGFTFDEAKKQIADHYRRRAEHWESLTFKEWDQPA
jgi:hypothetical protein